MNCIEHFIFRSLHLLNKTTIFLTDLNLNSDEKNFNNQSMVFKILKHILQKNIEIYFLMKELNLQIKGENNICLLLSVDIIQVYLNHLKNVSSIENLVQYLIMHSSLSFSSQNLNILFHHLEEHKTTEYGNLSLDLIGKKQQNQGYSLSVSRFKANVHPIIPFKLTSFVQYYYFCIKGLLELYLKKFDQFYKKYFYSKEASMDKFLKAESSLFENLFKLPLTLFFNDIFLAFLLKTVILILLNIILMINFSFFLLLKN